MNLHLVIFAFLLVVLIYAFNSLITKVFKKIEPKVAFLYMSAVAMVGVFGEVIVGNTYNLLFGEHLWNYIVYPIYGGFTSHYAPVIWGLYGLYLCLSHDTLMKKRKLRKEKHLALIFSIETIVLETLANWLYRLLFGGYLFFYLPDDLWHLSSLRGVPFYFLTGLAIFYVIKFQRTSPIRYGTLNTLLVVGLILLAS